MFDAHEKGGLLKAHATLFKNYKVIINLQSQAHKIK
jgi:hypothetical protein